MSVAGMLTIALLCAAGLYAGFAAVVLLGRVVVDRRHARVPAPADDARLAVRAARRAGRWRRAAALVELGRRHSAFATPDLYRRALHDRDPEIRGAAVRGLAPLAPERPWALDLLVRALEEGLVSRSRVAAHLDHLAPLPAEALTWLTANDRPQARYWAAMLLARYEDVAADRLVRLLRDEDATVRRAAVEALGVRGEREALPGVLALLDDETMYVRAHACRAAGRLGGVEVAQRLAPLLADREWWVRSAAKDTLRGFGAGVLEPLMPWLRSDDRFARNGAAEVLQDVGVLDRLATTFPGAPVVADIYAAGEQGLRRAAGERIAAHHEADMDADEAPREKKVA